MENLAERNDTNPWLFCNKTKGRISKESVERLMKRLGDRASIQNVHPHKYRRTFATSLCKKGMDLSTLQTLMGHADMNMTRKYVSLSQDYIQNQYVRFA